MRRLIGLATGLGLVVVLLGILGAPGSAQEADGQTISGTVSGQEGPVDGVTVDLFAGTADGKRLDWLGATTSGQAGPGRFSFDTADFDHGGPCWVVTFIAPEGEVFNNGLPWWNRTVCPPAGDSADGVDADLLARESLGQMRGSVVDGEGPVAGTQVDLFTALADGTRGTWLRSTVTAETGRFGIEATAGCYVLTYVASDGRTFEATGTRWLNRPQCLEADDDLALPEVRLAATAVGSATITGQVLDDGAGVPDVAVDLFTGPSYVETRRSDSDGMVRFEVDPGCFRVVFISPTERKVFNRGGGLFDARRLCVSAGEQAVIDPPPTLVERQVDRVIRVDFAHNGFPVVGRTLEIYEADENGTPGAFLASGPSGTGGGAGLQLEGTTGCWVARAIAEPDERFVSTGTRFRDDAFCEDDLDGPPFDREIRYEVEIAVTEADAPIDLGRPSFTDKTPVAGRLDGKVRFYRIEGPPGSTVVLSTPEDCTTDDDTVFLWSMPPDRSRIGGSDLRPSSRCDDFSGPPMPDGGVLLVAVAVPAGGNQFPPLDYRFDVRLTQTTERTIDISDGSPAVIAGSLDLIGDQTIITIRTAPGESLRLDGTGNPAATCASWDRPGASRGFRLTEGVDGPPLGFSACVDEIYTSGRGDGIYTMFLAAPGPLQYTFTATAQ